MTNKYLALFLLLVYATLGYGDENAGSNRAFQPSSAPNMNGEYILSQTPGATGTQEKFPTQYKDYPRGVEYFDVYSPLISQFYSQVFWKGLDPVDLPKNIVERYAGKGMAVVGFEMDQVRRVSNGTALIDIPVPINVAYNHHFESNMIGSKSKLELLKFKGPNDPRLAELSSRMGHGLPSKKEHWVVTDLAPENPIPTHQAFGGANGGEYRKSFHGYAPGYVQVIDSPTQFQITPMQIDTWNRDKMNLTGPTKFFTGPVPRSSLAPKDGLYSGLLECPVTTRIRKVIEGTYTTIVDANCAEGHMISSAAECFAAANTTLGNTVDATIGKQNKFHNTVVSDAGLPSGCSATTDQSDPSLIHVVYNKQDSSDNAVQCGGASTELFAGSTTSCVNITVHLDTKSSTATITLTGPSDVWFGVGFNATEMADQPYAIIVEGNNGTISERKLGTHNPGSSLEPSLHVISSTMNLESKTRKVVLTRGLKGKGPEYFTFDVSSSMLAELKFINALGSGPKLAYHKEKTTSVLSVLPVSKENQNVAGTCLCAETPAAFGQSKGKLVYVPNEKQKNIDVGAGSVEFNNNCAPAPRTDLLEMRNPTCDIRTYSGGQLSCHHMWSLLDADQEIPWTDRPLEYHLKFRFWVQPYNASYHTIVKRTTWGIASPVEYDVPKCSHGIPGCTEDPERPGTWIHTITGTYQGQGKLVAAHFRKLPYCFDISSFDLL
eukprot:g688.t1